MQSAGGANSLNESLKQPRSQRKANDPQVGLAVVWIPTIGDQCEMLRELKRLIGMETFGRSHQSVAGRKEQQSGGWRGTFLCLTKQFLSQPRLPLLSGWAIYCIHEPDIAWLQNSSRQPMENETSICLVLVPLVGWKREGHLANTYNSCAASITI